MWPLLVCLDKGHSVSLVFGWSRAVIFSTFSELPGFPFPGLLARETKLFLGLFGLYQLTLLSFQVLRLHVWDT